MASKTQHQSILQTAPKNRAFAITPHDSNLLPEVTNGIAFKTAGALHILDADGNEVTIPSGVLAAGVIHPLRVSKVFATGTGPSMDLWGFA